MNTSSTVLANCTDPLPSGNFQDFNYGYSSGSNNGNVGSFAATGQQNFNRSYTYDALNRIATMSAPGDACSGLSWTYDAWGNRTAQNVTGGTCWTPQTQVDNQNHLLPGPYQYDAAGNLMQDANHSYFYDAENRLIQVDGTFGNCSTATACYVYDAMGNRVEKNTSGYRGDYLYDVDGHTAAVLGNNTLERMYVYMGGKLLAEYYENTTYFVHGDHLGSDRLLSRLDQSVRECDDFYPFGELISCGGTTNGTTLKFTGKERDAESGLDNFGKRYHASSMGRFMTADPVGVMKQKLFDPQQWNMYAYARNNPLRFIDPTGMYATDCGSLNQKDCANRVKQIDAFVAKLGASKNQRDQDIAKTLGTSKDTKNGVTIGFVKEFKDKQGKVDSDKTGNTSGLFAPGQSTANGPVPAVRIDLKGSLSGNDLKATVEHEGSHATDRMAFAGSCTLAGCAQNLNQTMRQSEQNAYGDEYRFWNGVGEGQQHQSISSPDSINEFLRQHPREYAPGDLDVPLFPTDM